MSGVKKTIAQMKTPLDISLEEITTGAINPPNIINSCVRYNNLRYLRTFNTIYTGCLCSAVQSGSLEMLKRLLNQPYYNLSSTDRYEIHEIEWAIEDAVINDRQDMFDLLLKHCNYTNKTTILHYTMRYNMPHLYKLLPTIGTLNSLWNVALTYDADKIQPLLPELTFDWFIHSLPLHVVVIDKVLSSRQDFNTLERLKQIADTIFGVYTDNMITDEFLDMFVKHNMGHIIRYKYTRKPIINWMIRKYPEYITRQTVEELFEKQGWSISEDVVESVCKVITVDLDLLTYAIDVGLNKNAIISVINAMRSTQ